MNTLHRTRHDPFWDDGVGVRKDRLRRRFVGGLALALAIGACGLTTAMWLRAIAPALEGLVPV